MTDTDPIVDQFTTRFLGLLDQLLPTHPLESDFRRPVDRLLEEFCEAAGIQPLIHTEYTVDTEDRDGEAGAITVATGRADAVFNRMVVEYKRPGVLHADLSRRATRTATKQLLGYLRGLARRQRRELPRMGGAVLDGNHIIFLRLREERETIEDPLPVNKHTIRRLLNWMVSLSAGIALTPENLVNDFAIDQLRTQRILRSMKAALDESLEKDGGLVESLFKQWRLFFSESIDYSEAFGGRKLQQLRRFSQRAAIPVETASDAERFFFVLHTYFALLVKLLAWLALSRHMGGKLGALAFAQLAAVDDCEVRRRLEEMESGGIFRQYGLVVFLVNCMTYSRRFTPPDGAGYRLPAASPGAQPGRGE